MASTWGMRAGSARILATFGALACVSAAVGQDLSRQVTYTTVAVPASKALAAISELAKVRLEGTTETGKEIIVLRLKDVPLDEVMKRMAECMHAGWEKTETGYRLIRTDEMRRREKAEEYSIAVAGFARAKKARAAVQERLGAFDKARAHGFAVQLDEINKRTPNNGFWDNQLLEQAYQLRRKLPGARLAARLADAFSPETLAALPWESRTVFSNKPTRMQRPLPTGASKALAEYAREQAIWSAEAGPILDPLPGVDAENTYEAQTGVTPVDTALIEVIREQRLAVARFKVELYDANGAAISSGSADLTEDLTALAQQSSGAPASPEPIIELSPLAHEMSKLVNSSTGAEQNSLSAELRALIMDPEKTDPLSFLPSEGLIQTGEIRGENVVAVLPDQLVIRKFADPLFPSSFVAGLRLYKVRVSESDGWLMALPEPASVARETRANRHALGDLLRTLDKNGLVSIEELGKYAATTQGTHRDDLAIRWMSYVASYARAPKAFNPFFTWDLLRLYGSLSPSQRVEMESPAGMRMERLTGEQLTVAKDMVYGLYSSLRYDPRGDGLGLTVDEYKTWAGIFHEPTVCLPNGIPPDGRLRMGIAIDKVVFTDDQKPPVSGEDLAYREFYEGDSKLTPGALANPKTDFEGLRRGTRRQIFLSFNYTDVLVVLTGLTDYAMETGPPISFDQLPKAFTDKYFEMLAKLRQSAAGAPTSGSTRRPPPR